jgi:hypothetical protein
METLLAPARGQDTGARTRLWTALFLAVLAVATRALIFGDPLADSDEGYYLLVGQRMLHGALPYVDIWDRKPVGLFVLYALMRWLGGDGVLAYQIVGTVFAFLTALLVVRLAARFASGFGAAAAGAAYLLWLPLGAAAGGQAELFLNLPLTAAALITLHGLERPFSARGWLGGSVAMLLVGVAMQIKYDALFAGFLFGCCWLFAAWRSGRRLALVPLAVLWNLAALGPTLLALAYYAWRGHADAFMYANFVSVWQRGAPPLLRELPALAILLLILAPLFAYIRPFRSAPEGGRTALRFTLGWLAAAMAGFIAYRSYFQQFLLPVLMPASAAAAPTFGRISRKHTVVLLSVILALGQADLWISHKVHGSRREAQQILNAVNPRQCLYVYSGFAALYRMADTCIPTIYAFPSLLSRARESGAIGVDPAREVERIMNSRPGTVIVRAPYDGENWRARAVVLRHIRHSYHLVLRQQLGWHTVSVYRLGAPSRDRGRHLPPQAAAVAP